MGATVKNHAYPTDLNYYHLDNNEISFKINFDGYNSILGSYVDAKLLFVIKAADEILDENVQSCRFDDETKFVKCQIEPSETSKAWIIQTLMERRATITQDQKRDVIDQSPILNLDQLD